MESFVHEYINSTYDGEINEGLIERGLSPYGTPRPGDLATLLRLQTVKAATPLTTSTGFNRNHDNDLNENDIAIRTIIKTKSSKDIDDGIDGADNGDDSTRGDEGKPDFEIVCRGADTNDCPAEYTMKGLRHHEMPVMGVYVDKRICPGFQYVVRRPGSDRPVFKVPKTLLSVGMGYGKRITFSGDSLNNNDCFFWSDSEPNGYAFSIHAVDIGHKFSILDADNMIVGEAVVESIPNPQVEISSVAKNRNVTKQVYVTMNCFMKYYHRHNHGLVEMMVHEDTETVTGVAVLTKIKSDKQAHLTSIKEVFIDRFGLCKFELDV